MVCFFGWKLAQAAIWFVGFASGAIGFFWVTSWIMNLSGEFNCVVLGVVPLVGGVAGVCILNKIKRLAFFILGAAVGAAAGYYICAHTGSSTRCQPASLCLRGELPYLLSDRQHHLWATPHALVELTACRAQT